MFRKMRRFKQQISEEECIRVLKEAKRGVLSVIGDDGYPYGMPVNQWYNEENGILYFHGAKEGHKIDAIKACDKASFCAYDEGYRKDGDWALNINSVIVFGRIKPIEDTALMKKALEDLTAKFTDDKGYFEKEMASFSRVCILELTPEHMTGKLVNES